jgi:hypothetical protein
MPSITSFIQPACMYNCRRGRSTAQSPTMLSCHVSMRTCPTLGPSRPPCLPACAPPPCVPPGSAA